MELNIGLKEIYVFGEIDDDLARDTIESLLLAEEAGEEAVTVYINSDGGEVYSAFAIYDAIKMMHSRVTTVCIGKAFSAAVVILAAGDKSCITENSMIMMHEAYMDDADLRTIKKFETELAETKKINRRMISLISEKCGHSEKKIINDLKSKDKYFNSKEALDYGIVDEIIKPIEKNSGVVTSSCDAD